MILRMLALLALPVMAYYLAMSLSRRFSLTPRQNQILFVITAALLVIGVLVIMGRLPIHFILAPLGAAGAFLLRFLPTLLRLLPFWSMLKSRTSSGSARNSNQASRIKTEFFEMELSHSTGHMNGSVLKGVYSGKKLDDLALADLLQLHSECTQDADSIQVLEAYLDRMHDGWREQTSSDEQYQGSSADSESTMNQNLALEILGLEEGANKQDITRAHRALMQKLHPDRGGTDYLAQKINSAKECLLKQL